MDTLKEPIHIIIVDDTPVMGRLLNDQLVRHFKEKVKCTVFDSSSHALELFNSGELKGDILISDLEMPGYSGLDLFQEVHKTHPNMLLILLSGYADLEKITNALNKYSINGFIDKPWKQPRLIVVIENAIEKIMLQRENNRLLRSQEQSFMEIVSILNDVIMELAPDLSEHAHNVRDYCEKVARELKLAPEQIQNLKMAAMLHVLGLLGAPKEVYTLPSKRLSGEHRQLYLQYPKITADMLKSTPRLETVRQIILQHHENPDGTGFFKMKQSQLSIESQILRVCEHFDHNVFLRKNDKQETLTWMNRYKGKKYNSKVLKAFMRVITREINTLLIPVSVEDLQPNMKLGRDLYSASGRKVLAAGSLITNLNLKRLRVYNELDRLQEILIVAEH